jgi:hypothetical protein
MFNTPKNPKHTRCLSLSSSSLGWETVDTLSIDFFPRYVLRLRYVLAGACSGTSGISQLVEAAVVVGVVAVAVILVVAVVAVVVTVSVVVLVIAEVGVNGVVGVVADYGSCGDNDVGGAGSIWWVRHKAQQPGVCGQHSQCK